MPVTRPSRDDQILFVGDIQGSHQALLNLLRSAQFNPDRHRLIPLGDTINRGPKNLATLKTSSHLVRHPFGQPRARNPQSLPSKPAPSVAQDSNCSARLTKVETGHPLARLDRKLASLLIDRGYIAVHAGLHPTLSLLETPDEFLTRIRICNAQGERPPAWDGLNHTFPRGFHPWYRWYRGKKHVFYGHWARLGLNRQRTTTGLDSGCVYGNPLSAMWFPSMRLTQAS